MKWLSAGMTIDDILADDEDLEREDIFAVLEFATQLSKVKRLELAKPISARTQTFNTRGCSTSL